MTIYVNAGALRKSIDGGENWNALGPYDILAIDPLKSGALYAVSGRLLKSTDGGASWSEADKGLPQLDDCYGLSSLFVHPKDTSTLYAGVSLDYCSGGEEGGVWRSMNGGVTWMKLPSQPPGNNV